MSSRLRELTGLGLIGKLWHALRNTVIALQLWTATRDLEMRLCRGHGFVNKFIANFLRGLYRHRITIFRPGWTAANNMQMHWCSFVVRQARFPMMALVGFYSAHYMKNAQVPSELLSKSTRSQLDLYAICEVFGWLRLQLFWWNN